MRRAAWASAAVFAACAAALIFIFVLPPASPVAASNKTGDDGNLAFEPHPGARLPLGVKLVNENGRTVTLGRYFTKSPVILVLEYLRCTSLCGVTLRNLVGGTLNRLPLEAGRDYRLVAVSIDPRDKPADAAAARVKYAALLDDGGKSGLHFLTGDPRAVREIADAVGFHYRYDAFLDAYIHPAGFIIAAPDGVISHYVEGIAITPEQLIAAFADAQQDKSQGPLARIFLLCHIQGAPLGRFTVPVMAALTIANVAAGLTLIALFAVIRRQA
jgi:protein SCO1/2